MKWWVFIFGLSLLWPTAALGAGQGRDSDAQIRAAIKRMATWGSGDTAPRERFEIFYRNSYRSTELLIAALGPVRRGHYNQHPQAVWIIRALRSLTGLDFRAPTRADLTADEAHFLDHDPTSDQVCFFGTWMSRDRVWVAPYDAQRAIIQKWRAWFAKDGKNHKYVNDPDYDHWYY